MQEYALRIRTSLWGELKKVFEIVAKGNENISVSDVQFVVKNVIGETDQLQLDYIFKNLFRLDSDNSGSVSFNEFANFFLKRHCGEIALQRTHKKGLIGKGAQRKLNVDEFLALLTDAYSFLKVDVEADLARQVFTAFDQDKDSHITYVQYFTFIDKFICKNKATLIAEGDNKPAPQIVIPGLIVDPVVVVPQPVPIKVYQSRLRQFLWGELRILYDKFDVNFDGKLQTEEVRTLIRSILRLNSQKDIDYVLFNIFQLGDNGEIDFLSFCSYFIEHVANLGISDFLSNHAPGKKTINRDEFVRLFRNSFYFLNVSRIQDELLWGFFAKIDTDNDGLISFDQYIEWVKSFLSPHVFNIDIYYFDLDDLALGLGDRLITSEIVVPKKDLSGLSKLTKLSFSDLTLARTTRANLLKLLHKFDKNENFVFEQSEVVDIMKTLLRESDIEVYYVIHNVFRYDRDNDNRVTYPEMANFLLEMHCGEMAIQRRHLKSGYSQGAKRIMNVEQFIGTISDALGFLEATATDAQLRLLFSEVDLDKDGYITYREYFEFLRLYFGSGSIAAEEQVAPLPKISPQQEFAKWLNSESSKALRPYNLSANLQVDEETLATLLKKIFRQTDEEVDFVLRNLFKLIIDPNTLVSNDDLRRIIIFLHVGLINLLRGHKAHRWAKWNEFKLSKQDFIDLILAATEWTSLPADVTLLGLIFVNLDTDKDGFITYTQYLEFIKSCLLTKTNPALDDYINSLFTKPIEQPKPVVKTGLSEDQQKAEDFYSKIWEQLRILFNSYLQPGKTELGKQQIQKLIVEVLRQVSQQEHDYVFWNFFRLDKDGSGQVSFNQFAPYILSHAAQIALQRFHINQEKGKSQLSFSEFTILANKAYGFLKSISKQTESLKIVYALLDRSNTGFLSYGDYLRWSSKEVANHIR